MRRNVVRLGLLGIILAMTCLPHRAEVSTDILGDGQVQIVILGSTEGPDPFGMSWRPYRDIPVFRILNAAGDIRGDGRPDIARQPNGNLIVSWAWNNGLDHDIALSEWTDEGWTSPEFLTGTALDNLDPRLVAHDSGILSMVWWTRQTQSIQYSTRPTNSNLWSLPTSVTGPEETGRRPTMEIWDDSVFVAFERDSSQPDVAQELVIKVRNPDGTFSEITAARTNRIDRLDPVLHSSNGWIWMEWKQADDHFAYIYNGGEGWSEPINVPWTDPSWIGVENVRMQIRELVLDLGEAPILTAGDKGTGNQPPRQSATISTPFDPSLSSAPSAWHVNHSSWNREQQFNDDRKQP